MVSTYIVLYLLIVTITIEGTHFRGGSISWQTVSPGVTNTSTVAIQVQQTYSWAYSRYPCGPPIGDVSYLTCLSSSCSNYVRTMVGTVVPCTSYDVSLDVSTGESTTSVTLMAGSQLVIGYQGLTWLSLATGTSGSWSLITSIDLTVRSDNGRINSSPTSSMAAMVTVPTSTQEILRVPMADVDSDIVKCRWATSTTLIDSTVIDECQSACQNVPGSQLYSSSNLDNNCTLVFTASLAGYYIVALQIEDFMPSAPNGAALSSIPLQFLVLAISVSCNPPTIIGQLANEATVQVEANQTFSVSIIAQAGCTTTIINRFSTIALPQGTTLFSTVMSLGSLLYSMVFTWTPTVNLVGSTQIYCTMATDSNNLESTQYCLNLVVILLTTTTTTSTTSTSTTSTSSSTLTTFTDLTTTSVTSISPVIITQLINNLTVQLGLGLGLGLPLLLLLGALTTCACCRWCPGSFWKTFRKRFWQEKDDVCQLCRSRHVYRSHLTESTKTFDDSSGNYRQQYINTGPEASKKRLSNENSFVSSSLSPFDLGWMTTTRTTIMSPYSNDAMPSENVPIQTTNLGQPMHSTYFGSILVRSYVEQEGDHIPVV